MASPFSPFVRFCPEHSANDGIVAVNMCPLCGVPYLRITLRGVGCREAHTVILQSETAAEFVGWPDPSDSRNSEHWTPEDEPIRYPKFAWEAVYRYLPKVNALGNPSGYSLPGKAAHNG